MALRTSRLVLLALLGVCVLVAPVSAQGMNPWLPTLSSRGSLRQTTLPAALGGQVPAGIAQLVPPGAGYSAQGWQPPARPGAGHTGMPQLPVWSGPQASAPILMPSPTSPASVWSTVPGTLPQPTPRVVGSLGRRPEDADKPDTLGQLPFQMPLGHALAQPLPTFGYEFFAAGAQPPFETGMMSVSADYRIGPGDVLTIHAWNKIADESVVVEVNREGRVAVPRVGELLLMGQEYGALPEYLKREISRFLTDVNVAVALVKLRTFQVFVAGEVKLPGPVSVSAVNTAINALMAAGGPTQRGSLRAMILRRAGQVVAKLDYYELLLRGQNANEPRLQAGDVLFVPVVGATAAVNGMVKRPAIYELAEGDTLASLIGYAGGLTPAAYPQRVVVYRTKDNARREIRDIKAQGSWQKQAAKVAIRDGDVVSVPQITTVIENSLTLRGNVERPGEYEWREGMRLKDLIGLGRRLLPGTLMSRVEVIRVRKTPAKMDFNNTVQTETIREMVALDLGKAMAGDPANNILLEPRDDVNIHNVRDGGPVPQVVVVGEVVSAGTYELVSGMRVRDLVFMAGGVRLQAHLTRVEIARRLSGGGHKVLPVDLAKALAGDAEHNVLLENFDTLTVHSDPRLTESIRVTISGEVKFPGIYQMYKGDRASTLLERAGGLTDYSFLDGAIFSRVSVMRRQEEQKDEFVEEQRKIIVAERASASRLPDGAKPLVEPQSFLSEAEKLVDRLEKTPAEGRLRLHLATAIQTKGSSEDVLLEDGDHLKIPRTPAEISVTGEVFTPGAFLFKPERDISSYIQMAGGTTARAWRRQVFLVRADGSALSASQSDDSWQTWDGLHLGRSVGSTGFMRMKVKAGDAIFVPTDYRVRRDKSAEIIDRLYKVAVSVGALAGVLK